MEDLQLEEKREESKRGRREEERKLGHKKGE